MGHFYVFPSKQVDNDYDEDESAQNIVFRDFFVSFKTMVTMMRERETSDIFHRVPLSWIQFGKSLIHRPTTINPYFIHYTINIIIVGYPK